MEQNTPALIVYCAKLKVIKTRWRVVLLSEEHYLSHSLTARGNIFWVLIQYSLCSSCICPLGGGVFLQLQSCSNNFLLSTPPCCVFYTDVYPPLMLYFFSPHFRTQDMLGSMWCQLAVFPIQMRRIRSCSCEDRSLEWTHCPPVGMTDHFSSTFPPCSNCWLWCGVYVPAREKKKKIWMRVHICWRGAGTKWHKGKILTLLSCISGACISSLTYKHDI